MAEYKNNIHVNFDVNDSIDAITYLPSVFRIQSSESGIFNINNDLYISLVDAIDTYDIQVEATLSGVLKSSNFNHIVDISMDDLFMDTPVPIEVNFCTSITTNKVISYVSTFLIYRDIFGTEDIDVSSYIGTSYDASFTDIQNIFHIYIDAVDVKTDVPVDLYISNNKYYNYPMDQYSTILDLVGIGMDFEQGPGKVANTQLDAFSSGLILNGEVLYDSYCTESGVVGGCRSDITTISGGQTYIQMDGFSSLVNISGSVNCDIRTWSLEFGDFFADHWSVTTASGSAWIDIIDTFCSIDTGNCYFSVDGERVESTFVTIDGGYRMCYDPIDNFSTLLEFQMDVHAQNFYGDILENSYKFLYGADIRLHEVVTFVNKKYIPIWAKVNNVMDCPEFSTVAYKFETKDYYGKDLGAYINPVIGVDLPVILYPQNTFFFYGRTYRIGISGLKDFSGNVKSDYIYTFTIENPLE